MAEESRVTLPDELSGPGSAGSAEDSTDGDSTMADVPANVHEQTLARLSSAGAGAHEHHVQFGKVLDYSYEQDRKMVSLVESLGVREVTSKSGQTGIPMAANG